MSSVVKLRVINTIGSGIFAIYALAIASYPTALLNFGLVAINIYHLMRMRKHDELFYAHTIDINNEFLKSFIMYNGKDIQRHSDNYTLGSTDANTAIFVYCDLTAAGVLIGKNNGDGTLRIDLDYATPEYRDFRVGKFLYKKLADMGFNKVTIKAHETEIEYLTKMGFEEENGLYVKNI